MRSVWPTLFRRVLLPAIAAANGRVTITSVIITAFTENSRMIKLKGVKHLQILSNRAYLVAQVDDANRKFASKAIVLAEGPEQAVRKVRTLLSKKGDQMTESPEMNAIELGDVPDSCDIDDRLILKFGDEFEW